MTLEDRVLVEDLTKKVDGVCLTAIVVTSKDRVVVRCTRDARHDVMRVASYLSNDVTGHADNGMHVMEMLLPSEVERRRKRFSEIDEAGYERIVTTLLSERVRNLLGKDEVGYLVPVNRKTGKMYKNSYAHSVVADVRIEPIGFNHRVVISSEECCQISISSLWDLVPEVVVWGNDPAKLELVKALPDSVLFGKEPKFIEGEGDVVDSAVFVFDEDPDIPLADAALARRVVIMSREGKVTGTYRTFS